MTRERERHEQDAEVRRVVELLDRLGGLRRGSMPEGLEREIARATTPRTARARRAGGGSGLGAWGAIAAGAGLLVTSVVLVGQRGGGPGDDLVADAAALEAEILASLGLDEPRAAGGEDEIAWSLDAAVSFVERGGGAWASEGFGGSLVGVAAELAELESTLSGLGVDGGAL